MVTIIAVYGFIIKEEDIHILFPPNLNKKYYKDPLNLILRDDFYLNEIRDRIRFTHKSIKFIDKCEYGTKNRTNKNNDAVLIGIKLKTVHVETMYSTSLPTITIEDMLIMENFMNINPRFDSFECGIHLSIQSDWWD